MNKLEVRNSNPKKKQFKPLSKILPNKRATKQIKSSKSTRKRLKKVPKRINRINKKLK